MQVVSQIYTILIELLYPDYCCSCGRGSQVLCDDCYEQIEYLSSALKLPFAPHLDSVQAAMTYAGPVKKLVKSCKFGHVLAAATALGKLLYLSGTLPNADCVCPVPLHWQRKNMRGFNQAEVVARTLANQSGVQMRELLLRTHATAPQAQTHDRSQRQDQMAQAFELHPSIQFSALPSSVVLIDDVCTTGSTLNACAQVLKSAGVAQVHALTVAHGMQ